MGSVQILDHTADMRLKAAGRDLSDLFAALAKALSSEITTGYMENRPPVEETWVFEVGELECAVELANEILYRLQVRRHHVLRLEIEEESERWSVRVELVPVAGIVGEVKAATYNEVILEREEEGCTLEITFDR